MTEKMSSVITHHTRRGGGEGGGSYAMRKSKMPHGKPTTKTGNEKINK